MREYWIALSSWELNVTTVKMEQIMNEYLRQKISKKSRRNKNGRNRCNKGNSDRVS